MDNLYQVKKKDLPQCARVLARAFYDYPMYKYILGEQHSRENIETTTRFFITYAFYYAKVFASSPEIEGVVSFVDYQDYKINLFRFFRCGGLSLARLGPEVGKRYADYDRFYTKVHKQIIKEPHKYIMFIGVDPDKQGQGFGSRLLRPILHLARDKGYPVYLETHSEQNVDIYRNFGFKLAATNPLPNSDVIMYSMLRA